jgi:hypothetical protein
MGARTDTESMIGQQVTSYFPYKIKKSELVIAIRNKWLYIYVPWHMWGLNKMLHLSFWIYFIYHKKRPESNGLCITCIVATLYMATNFSCMTLLKWKPHLAKILESAVSNLDPVMCKSHTHFTAFFGHSPPPVHT